MMRRISLPTVSYRALPIVFALSLTACVNLAPKYVEPTAPIPSTWSKRANPADLQKERVQSQAEQVKDIEWRNFLLDAHLREVVALALENNRNLRVAVLNIQKARAQYQIQDATRYPAFNGGADITVSRIPAKSTGNGNGNGNGSPTISREYSVGLGISSYELDFFGRLQNLSTAALETYQYNVETRRSAQISLIAEVAGAWMTLAANIERLALTRDTLKNQERAYALTKGSHDIGVRSGLDVVEAQASVDAASADEWHYINQVAQDTSRLNLLVGIAVPASLLPDNIPDRATMLISSTVELPSSLLLRRPDILAAEHTLIAANANIGAARAAFFPSITLTAQGGTASSSLSRLFNAGSGNWLFMPSINVPIFNAGSNKASLDVATVTRDITIANYEKTVQIAFKEVDDALTQRSTLAGQLAAQHRLTNANAKSYQLSEARYRSGIDNYLNALISQRSLYNAQLNLIGLRLAEQTSHITLYRVMGGGWTSDS